MWIFSKCLLNSILSSLLSELWRLVHRLIQFECYPVSLKYYEMKCRKCPKEYHSNITNLIDFFSKTHSFSEFLFINSSQNKRLDFLWYHRLTAFNGGRSCGKISLIDNVKTSLLEQLVKPNLKLSFDIMFWQFFCSYIFNYN